MKTFIAAFACAAAALGLGTPVHAQGQNPPEVNPAHYQCYRVEAPTRLVRVKLRDQFGASAPVTVATPMFLCAPTDKNGMGIKDEVTHLLCYQDRGVKTPNKRAVIRNQFGEFRVAIGAAAMLCVPSLKKLV